VRKSPTEQQRRHHLTFSFLLDPHIHSSMVEARPGHPNKRPISNRSKLIPFRSSPVSSAARRGYLPEGYVPNSGGHAGIAHQFTEGGRVDIKMHPSIGSGCTLINGSEVHCADRANNLVAISAIGTIPATDRCRNDIGRHWIDGRVPPAGDEASLAIGATYLRKRLTCVVVVIGHVSSCAPPRRGRRRVGSRWRWTRSRAMS